MLEWCSAVVSMTLSSGVRPTPLATMLIASVEFLVKMTAEEGTDRKRAMLLRAASYASDASSDNLCFPRWTFAVNQVEYSRSLASTLFARKAALDLPVTLETMCKLFQLTPGESRVLAASLRIGVGAEVATVLGIAETTLKTHLQHIFAKTGAANLTWLRSQPAT